MSLPQELPKIIMGLLTIVKEGDARLRQKSTKIRQADESLRRLAADMHETMDAAPGVGLAAPQVGVNRRLIVVHKPADEEEPRDTELRLTILNPEIVRAQGEDFDLEGCLSIPGWVGEVRRAWRITVKGQDLDNKDIRIKAEGYLARILQHEIDHLDGVLFVDLVEDQSTLRLLEDETAPVNHDHDPAHLTG